MWLLATIGWVLWRDRLGDGPSWRDTGIVGAVALGVVGLHMAHVGPLVTHDAARDLLWAVEMAEGTLYPSESPLAWPCTDSRAWCRALLSRGALPGRGGPTTCSSTT